MPANGNHAKGASLDLQGRSVCQGLSHFAPGFGHDPLKGGSRDPHLPGSVFLVTLFQVSQAQSLQLFMEQRDDIQRF
jgi:hypothetical protein